MESMTPNNEPELLREQATPYAPPAATQRLIDELYREELREARETDPTDKILAGQRLFESACRITLAGIRHQNPGASEEECVRDSPTAPRVAAKTGATS